MLHLFKHKKKSIVLFGNGKSGTTWLADIIVSAGLKFVFEPLNSRKVPELGD